MELLERVARADHLGRPTLQRLMERHAYRGSRVPLGEFATPAVEPGV